MHKQWLESLESQTLNKTHMENMNILLRVFQRKKGDLAESKKYLESLDIELLCSDRACKLGSMTPKGRETAIVETLEL